MTVSRTELTVTGRVRSANFCTEQEELHSSAWSRRGRIVCLLSDPSASSLNFVILTLSVHAEPTRNALSLGCRRQDDSGLFVVYAGCTVFSSFSVCLSVWQRRRGGGGGGE